MKILSCVVLLFSILMAQDLPFSKECENFELRRESSADLRLKNLVVLDSASVEIIYMLGAENAIRAIATLQQSSIYPSDKTAKLPSVGTFSNPSIEKIISFKPDLIILNRYALGLKERLEKLGFKTLYLEAERLSDISKNITHLGEILGREEAANALNARFACELNALKSRPIDKSAIFLFSSTPLMAFSQNSIIADILEVLGMPNLTPPSEVKRPIITNEFILKANPEILLLGIEANDIEKLLSQNPMLKNTRAAQNGQIFVYRKIYPLMRLSPNILNAVREFRGFVEGNLKKDSQDSR